MSKPKLLPLAEAQKLFESGRLDLPAYNVARRCHGEPPVEVMGEEDRLVPTSTIEMPDKEFRRIHCGSFD